MADDAKASPLALRTATGNYVLTAVALGGPTLLAAVTAIQKDSGFWIPTSILFPIFAASMAWLWTTTLVLDSHRVYYRSLSIERNIPLEEIRDARFAIGFARRRRQRQPFLRVELTLQGAEPTKHVTISAIWFDHRATRRWVTALNERLGQRAE